MGLKPAVRAALPRELSKRLFNLSRTGLGGRRILALRERFKGLIRLDLVRSGRQGYLSEKVLYPQSTEAQRGVESGQWALDDPGLKEV